MQLPLQITFRNMDPSDAIEAQIRKRAEELNHFHERIMSCRVVVEPSSRHQHKGRLYHLRIDITVPGGEIVVKRDPPEDHAHEDIYVTIRDAFDAARRQIEDHTRRARGDVKTHEPPEHGRIISFFADEDYGFIGGSDGQEIYMHRNSVTDGSFDDLAIGDEVRYFVHPGEGDKGPQASSVTRIGKHHQG